jgi:hypothetical protein
MKESKVRCRSRRGDIEGVVGEVSAADWIADRGFNERRRARGGEVRCRGFSEKAEGKRDRGREGLVNLSSLASRVMNRRFSQPARL